MFKKRIKKETVGLLFALPALIYMCALVVYPIISNIILSFQEVTVKTFSLPQKPFVGLDNYIEMFQDPVLLTAIKNTLIFTVCCIAFQFLIGFAMALLFSKKFTASQPVRGLLMMPWMIPITVTALMFKFMFGSNVGIINQALMAVGLIGEPVEWLTTSGTAMFALIVTNVWIGIPFNMILISTGLSTIPKELYESASVDGANRITTFFHITLPLLRPTIESVLILGFIYTFKVFDLVYVMTGGGPVNTTQMLSTLSYKESFEMFNYSKGAAVANILFVILLLVSILYLKATYKEED